MKYVLGTASFGLDYGISNEFKQVKKNSALEIIKQALNNDFYGVDSAQSYGDAHSIISEALKINGNFHITSKLGKSAFSSKDALILAIESIINDLGIRKLDVLLIHDFDTLLNYDKRYLRNLLYEVQQLLGHSNSQMTQRYAHLMDSPLRAGVDAVASAFRPKPRLVRDVDDQGGRKTA
jgi:aryl-alcohol dehydrogenase-like predicted oxidoreductase